MDDRFGDRMKSYEMTEAGRRFMPLLPVVARIDGRTFSSFTKGLNRPFDSRFNEAMIETTETLVDLTNARIGYTQSDEISLGFYSPDYDSQIFFAGRIQKMVSQLAALASVHFNKIIETKLSKHYVDKNPTFDARVWQLPTLMEATNVFVWREWDATKNSISMAARKYYSHADLMHKNGSEMQELLFQAGVNWNDYPRAFKRGTYIQRHTVSRSFTVEELETLPPKHEAHTNPELKVERSEIKRLDLPPITKITNRVEVLFFGEEPNKVE